MVMAMKQLRTQLSAIEPDDSTYRGVGASEVGLLGLLVAGGESWLAARAVHALSRIDAESAYAVLLAAGDDTRPEVRVAVAASARALPPNVSDELLFALLGDLDAGVRKFAIKSVSDRNSVQVKDRLREAATTEPSSALRDVAIAKATSLQAY